MDAHASKLTTALPKMIVIWPTPWVNQVLILAGVLDPGKLQVTVNAGLLGLPADWPATLQAATAGINPPQKSRCPGCTYNKGVDLTGWRSDSGFLLPAAPASR
jgi:hypothetical protein